MPWRWAQQLVFVALAAGVPALAAGLAFDAVPFVRVGRSREPARRCGHPIGERRPHPAALNGKVPSIRARAGAPQRCRMVNAPKSRYFLLNLEDQPFSVIGSDGGLQESPQRVDEVLITPGERADVIVTPTGKRGRSLVLRGMLYNRGTAAWSTAASRSC